MLQQVGKPNALTAVIREESEGELKAGFNRREIFTHYPAVFRCFEDKVPSVMTSEVFWDKFALSQYIDRDRGAHREVRCDASLPCCSFVPTIQIMLF